VTLDEIVSQAEREYGALFSVKRAQIVKFADYIQKIAFNRDLDVFLVWDAFVTGLTTSLGPYPWPTTIPVRNMLGVTRVTDLQLLGNNQRVGTTDYGMTLNDFNERNMYEAGRQDVFAKTFTFTVEPITEANFYRWIYYRRAPTILGTTVDDDASLLIDEEFHQTLMVDGIGALCDKATWGGKTPEEVLNPYLMPYWESLVQGTIGKGKDSDGISIGQP